MRFHDRVGVVCRATDTLPGNDGGKTTREEASVWIEKISASSALKERLRPEDEATIRGIIGTWESAALHHRVAVAMHLNEILPRAQAIVPTSTSGTAVHIDPPCTLDRDHIIR